MVSLEGYRIMSLTSRENNPRKSPSDAAKDGDASGETVVVKGWSGRAEAG